MTAATVKQSFQNDESAKPVQTLFNAVSSIKLRLVRLLIEGGIDVDTKNDREQTPLLAACSSLQNSHLRGETRSEVVKYLISAGANVNVQDDTGRTPLVYAVITQAHASVIFDLVEAGAELWLEDMSQKCAFDYALQRQDMSQVDVIVKAYKRCNSTSHNNFASFREKLGGIFKHVNTGKGMLMARRKASEERKVQIFPRRKQGESNHTLYAAFQKMHNDISTQIPVHPAESTISHGVLDHESQLCSLCKNVVVGDQLPTMHKDSNGYNKSEKPTDLLDLNFQGYNLSGLIYRRRSTGSFSGLTDEQCEAIKRKENLGITLEDLFSTPAINHPDFGSTESMFVKSPHTNTMVDISSKSLSVPCGNRGRSASVCLPPRDHQIFTEFGRAFSFSTDDDGGFFGEPRESPATASPSDDIHHPSSRRLQGLQRIYMADSAGYEDEDWDDILFIPSTKINVAPANNSTSDQEVTSPEERTRSFSGICDRSSSLGSPIPRIVFTDFVSESHGKDDKDE